MIRPAFAPVPMPVPAPAAGFIRDGASAWEVERHRARLAARLGRDVGSDVARLDYLVNVRHDLADAVVVERTELESLQRSAMVDALTGLFNRRYFDHALEREMERCRRSGTALSVLLLDVDDFKSLNDRHGHCFGDDVLRRMGELLCKQIRAIDVPCRYGGDELAIILPDIDPEDAVAAAHRIRIVVERTFRELPRMQHASPVTVSGGLSSFPSTAGSTDVLIERADRVLYEAKRAGRNRICAWGVDTADSIAARASGMHLSADRSLHSV